MAGKDKKGVDGKAPASEAPAAEESQSTIVEGMADEEATKEAPAAEESKPDADAGQPDPEISAPAASGDAPSVDEVEAVPEVVKVIVTVPKAFKLTLPRGVVLSFSAGVQTVEKSIADHWYSKANGMKIFNPDA